MKTKVEYFISMKSCYGNYTRFKKEFNDERHFENWYDFMSNKGHKIIGVEKIKSNLDRVKDKFGYV
jgi:hypothetical protein